MKQGPEDYQETKAFNQRIQSKDYTVGMNNDHQYTAVHSNQLIV